ncbi:MAG: hypothetical protein HY077_03260 [Elusimicrobia bacterium]|nr:hypothetical protein [Elusimicrobiota bacterium]
MSPALFYAFNSLALSWAACGDYAASSATWAAAGPTILVPFKGIQTLGRELQPADLALPDDPTAGALAVDEADGLVPEGSWLRLLRALSAKRPSAAWTTVSGAVGERRDRGRAAAATAKTWPTWAGGTTLWTSRGASRRAWKLYGEAAAALARYQNSGAANLKNLEDATAELYSAQSGRYYRLLSQLGPERAAADRELRDRLVAVYRKTRQTPPEGLFISLLAEGGPRSGEDDETEAGSTDIHYAQGDSWLSFDNPPGSLARAPEGADPLPDGAPQAELWRIKGLRVEWDSAGLTFIYRLARLAAPDGGADLGQVMLDTYIDLNHTAGAGSVPLLPGRPGALAARDAWEYALTLSAAGAYLYRSNPLGSPLQEAKLAMSTDPQKGEIRVSVPSTLVKGNPLRWGYAVLALAADRDTLVRPPPRPAVDPKRGAILGLLAPLEQQKGVSSDPARPRLGAVRMPAGPL